MTPTLRAAFAVLALASAGASAFARDVPAAPAGEGVVADADAPPVFRAGARGSLQVRRFKPRSGRSNVDPATEVKVQFTAPLDPQTINFQSVRFRKLNGEPVRYSTRIESDGKLLVLVPDAVLEPATDYQITVSPGLTDTAGRGLRRERTAIFFTDPRFSQPVLLPSQFAPVEDVLAEGRAAHTASVTATGRVLIVGGQIDPVVFASSVEVFEPGADTFRVVAGSVPPRAYHASATFVNDVWCVGGWNGTAASSSTLYANGASLGVQVGPAMTEERDFVAAAPLPGGRLLVTGGLRYLPGGAAVYSQTAEVLDNGAFRATFGRPVRRRAGHTLTPLPDGRVLVLGGFAQSTGIAPTAEIFDPVNETFTEIATPAQYHRQIHNATLLDGGGFVLVTDGGNSLAEVLDLSTGRFAAAGGGSFVSRSRSGAALLPDGRVLIVGGLSQQGSTQLILGAVDVYDPNRGGDYGSILNSGVLLDPARAGHTVSALRTGQVLICGGFEPTGFGQFNLDSAVLFTPEP